MTGADSHLERQLIERVVAGDKTAFGHLAKPHIGRLLTLARRMLSSTSQAEDAVQDALASVWVARQRLDPERPVGPLLTTSVLNKCRDNLRRRKAAGLIGIAPSLDEIVIADDRPDPEVSAVTRDMLAALQREIERLPVRLREALVLVAIDGCSQVEAADLVGVTEKTIETRVYRARKRLRERIPDF